MGSVVDDAIASAQQCREGEAIEVPIYLWSKDEIEDLYAKLPGDLSIDPEGQTPGCARIFRRQL